MTYQRLDEFFNGPTLSIGNRLSRGNQRKRIQYILSQVDMNMVCLISLSPNDSNRWTNAVPVDDVYHITMEEMDRITGTSKLSSWELTYE